MSILRCVVRPMALPVIVCCVLLQALFVQVPRVQAQSVRGTVTDAGARPVAGAVVTLVDSASATVARALTNEAGEFRLLALRGGTFRLRTARIGYLPVLSAPLVLAAGETRAESVRISFLPLGLDTVRVAARSACRRQSGPGSSDVFALWDQARTALTAAQLTAAARAITATSVVYERAIERGSRRIKSQDAAIRTETVTQPWRAIALDTLRRQGYVITDDENGATYYAPDLDVLLASSFLVDHCLRFEAAKDPSEIGVRFEPNADRRAIAEIAGTLWMDRATARLKRLDYRYVNVAARLSDEAGGQLVFAPLLDGSWAIVRWDIRMPATYRETPRGRWRIAELRSSGGELVTARRRTDTLWTRSPIALTGTIVDSTTGAALAGARVSLNGTTNSATTDGRGRFVLADLLPGEYQLDVRTASLDSVGAVHRHAVSFTDSVQTLRLAVPNARLVAGRLCGAGGLGRGTGALVGRLAVRGDTLAPSGVRVAAEWTVQQIVRGQLVTTPKRLETKTDAVGNWRLCGVPTEQLLSVRALPPAGRATPVTARLGADELFASAELLVDPAATPVASLQGVVVSADSSARPVLDAEVTLPELSLTTRTDGRGAFRIDDIPVGTHRLVVRRLGFGALDTPLTFEANEREERRVVLNRVTVLDSVDVRAEYVIPTFEEHKKIGLGHFLTRDELAKMENRTFGALMTNFVGVRIAQGVGGRMWLATFKEKRSLYFNALPVVAREDRIQGAPPMCYSRIIIDNVPVYSARDQEPLFDLRQIHPDEIEALEYYKNNLEIPARYTDRGPACGLLVIWTRRTYPDKK